MIPKVYDDIYSIIHTVLGGVSGFMLKHNPIYTLAVISLFTAYQLREREKIKSKLGDFIEFGIGFIIGSII